MDKDPPTTALRRLPWVKVQTSSGPILCMLQVVPGFKLHEGTFGKDTGLRLADTAPSPSSSPLPASGIRPYELKVLDCNFKNRRAAVPQTAYTAPPKDVRWEMIAECPRMPVYDPCDVRHTPKEDSLDLSNYRPMPVLVKEEAPDTGDNSLDGPPQLHPHDASPHFPEHPGREMNCARPEVQLSYHGFSPTSGLVVPSRRLDADRPQEGYLLDLRTRQSVPVIVKGEAPCAAKPTVEVPLFQHPDPSVSPVPPHHHHHHHHHQQQHHHHLHQHDQGAPSRAAAVSYYYQEHLRASGVRNTGAAQCETDYYDDGLLDLRTRRRPSPDLTADQGPDRSEEPMEGAPALHPLALPPHPHYSHRVHHPHSRATTTSDLYRHQPLTTGVTGDKATTYYEQENLLDLRIRHPTSPPAVPANAPHHEDDCYRRSLSPCSPSSAGESTSPHLHIALPGLDHPPTPLPLPPPPIHHHHHHQQQQQQQQHRHHHLHQIREPALSADHHPKPLPSPERDVNHNHPREVDRYQSNYSPISSVSTDSSPEDMAEEEEEEGVEGGEEVGGESTERKGSGVPTRAVDRSTVRNKPGRKKGQVSKVLHLWEFILDLLRDPSTCPRIIHWENEKEGVFRVLQSSEVARLWGEKKRNKKVMTYEKLSRSLRYSRKEGFFDSLPKGHAYPKKLCFKFGPRSYGWRDITR